jgi:hypothetical protein
VRDQPNSPAAQLGCANDSVTQAIRRQGSSADPNHDMPARTNDLTKARQVSAINCQYLSSLR